MFGLNCTTFGCELNKTNSTKASRLVTTVPLNITQLISTNNSSAENASNYPVSVHGNQSNSTIFNVCCSEQNDLTSDTTSTEENLTLDMTTAEEVTATTSNMTTAEGVMPTTSDMTTAEKGTSTTYSTSSIQVASTPTAPATSSIDSSLAEELESTISNVSSIVSTMRNLHVFLL